MARDWLRVGTEGDGMGEAAGVAMPKPVRLISTISPATVPVAGEERELVSDELGVDKVIGEGEGVGVGVGVGVGEGEGSWATAIEGSGVGIGVGVGVGVVEGMGVGFASLGVGS